MSEKGFFAGVDSAPGIDNYPPSEIRSIYHITNSPTTRNYNTTTTNIFQSSVDHAMEARDSSIAWSTEDWNMLAMVVL